MSIQPVEQSTPASRFVWHARDGDVCLGDMETRHLFYTVRMIWNHWAPEALRFEPYKRYRFGARYTGQYMSQAIRAMLPELARRHDLTPWQRDNLCQMRSRALAIPELSS